MQKQHTDLGTNEIHKRHSVMVEGGAMPRAKVMDQMVIDRYLINGSLSLSEHQAGEYILNQASKAGVFGRPLRYEAGSSSVRQGDSVFSDALMRYGRTMSLISRRFGDDNKKLVESVVLENKDVSQDLPLLSALKKSLDLVSQRRMAGGRNPLRHLKKVGGQPQPQQ